MRTWFAVAVISGVVSIASASYAQSADGSGIPVAEEVEGYPQALVDRPILLPHGAEGTLTFRTSKNDAEDLLEFVDMEALGRVGTGRVELFGGFGVRAKQPDETDREKLSTIFGGAAIELGPDQVLRGLVAVYDPVSEIAKILRARGDFEIKRKLAPTVAVVATGGIDFINLLPDEPAPDPIWTTYGFAQGEGQIQLTPTLAASGAVTASFPVAYSPDYLDPEPHTVFDFGAQGTMSLAPNFDVIGGFIVSDAFEERYRNTYFFVGGAVRL